MKDKVIVIIGSNGGLGRALTELLSSQGAVVVGLNRSKADVTRENEVERFSEEVLQEHGRIDMWINNAGIWMPPQDITEIDLEQAKKLIEVNVFGTIHGMRAAARIMKGKGGVIVNILSTTAFDGMNGSSGSMYVASKYALRGLCNTVRQESEPQGINLIAIYPGGFKTDLFKDDVPENFDQFMTAEYVAEKIVIHLEKDNPEKELIIPRPGQHMPHDIR